MSLVPITPVIGAKALFYGYDGLHRRILRTTKEWNGSAWVIIGTSRFLYDGWNVKEEYTITSGTQALARTHTWGADLSGTLQGAGGVGGLLLTEEINGNLTTAYHYQYDGNGNVTEISTAAGTTAATYRYDAFGNALVASGAYAAQNRYRFSTKPLDTEIPSAALYYYGYRFYDPVTGRWPSRDPIEEEGGINLYGFILNSPIGTYDLLGLSSCCPSDNFSCDDCSGQCSSCPIEEKSKCESDCRNAKLNMKCGPEGNGGGGPDDDDDDEGGGGGGSCFDRCMRQSGGYGALAALGVGTVGGGSVPTKRLFGAGVAGGGRSGSTWTTVPSMAANAIGGPRGRFGAFARGLRNFGRKANPVGRVVQAAAGGYAAGVAASCAANCAINPNFF